MPRRKLYICYSVPHLRFGLQIELKRIFETVNKYIDGSGVNIEDSI